MTSKNYGRVKILTDLELNGDIQHDKKVIPLIIEQALASHEKNVMQYKTNESWYFNDTSSILTKVKYARPEIDNKFTFATAKSIVNMNNGYCFGTPFKYVCDEAEDKKKEEMQAFIKCLDLANNNLHTFECADNAAVFGIGYKLALPPTEEDRKKGIFFKIVSDIDNYKTFTVYSNDIERKEVLGVIWYDKKVLNENNLETSVTVYNCWTKWHKWIFESDDNNKTFKNDLFNVVVDKTQMQLDAYPLKMSSQKGKIFEETLIPIQEYERTGDRIGDFELSIALMNAINILACCRLDSVQQTTDFVFKFRDIDIGEWDENGENPKFEKIMTAIKHHILAVDSVEGAIVQPEISVLDIPLNQSEVQKFQDFLYDMLLEELQQPTRSSGSGQDTGIAVENRNGFRQFENHAAQISEYAIKSEMEFIGKLLEIGKMYADCPFKNLELSDIKINAMRNRSENLMNSVNAYKTMKDAGVNPSTAYSVSGLVADVVDTVKKDEEYKNKETIFENEQEIQKAKELSKIKQAETPVDNKKNADERKTDKKSTD